jgi:hypothetical protein
MSPCSLVKYTDVSDEISVPIFRFRIISCYFYLMRKLHRPLFSSIYSQQCGSRGRFYCSLSQWKEFLGVGVISYQFYTPVSHHITCCLDYSDCRQYGVLMAYRETHCCYYWDHLSPIGTAAGDVGATCNLLGSLTASRTAGQIVAKYRPTASLGTSYAIGRFHVLRPEDGSSIFLWNVGNDITDCTASHLRKQLTCIQVLLDWNFVGLYISQFSHACYISRPSHPWFYIPWRVQIVKPPITWFSPASCHFLPRGCKWSA